MLVLRGLGLGGLQLGGLAGGQPQRQLRGPSVIECTLNPTLPGCWASGSPTVPSTPSAPSTSSGFCWIPEANGVPGHWERERADQPCQFAPPADGGVVVRDQRGGGGGGGVTVSDYKDRRWINTLIAKQLAVWEARRHDIVMALYATNALQWCKSWSCGVEYKAGNFGLLNPIGVIVELGVAFSPEELGAGYLEKTYQPTDEQKFQADLAVYGCSQRYIAKQMTGADLEPIWDFWDPAYARLNTNDPNSKLLQAVARTRLSVQQLLQRFPQYTLSIPGYSLNPDPPTASEMSSEGGLYAYYKRGGYVLTTDCSNGVVPAARASIAWSEGYCACGIPPGQSGGAQIMRDAGGTPTSVLKRAAGEGFGWDTHITVGPTYKIRIKPHDAPWWSEAGSFIGNTMKSLAAFICQNQPLIQQLNNDTLLKEYCFDATNKPCTKGAAGCTCTKPTSVQQGAIGVANAAVSKWCSLANKPAAADPTITPLAPKEEPPPGPALWMLIGSAIIGAGAGALAALRRR